MHKTLIEDTMYRTLTSASTDHPGPEKPSDVEYIETDIISTTMQKTLQEGTKQIPSSSQTQIDVAGLMTHDWFW